MPSRYPITDFNNLNLDWLIETLQDEIQDRKMADLGLEEQIKNIIITPTVIGGNFYNIKNAGAVGDGVTDDSDAMRTALSLSRQIYIPEGRFLVDDIDLAGDPLIMAGPGTLVFKAGTDFGLYWMDQPDVVFMGLTFERGPKPKIVANNDYVSDTNGGAAIWIGSGNQGTGRLAAFVGCRFVCVDYSGYDWDQYGVFVHGINLETVIFDHCTGDHANCIWRGTRADSVANGYYARVDVNHFIITDNVFHQVNTGSTYNTCFKIDNEPVEVNTAYANDSAVFTGNVFTADAQVSTYGAFGVGYVKNAYYAGNTIRNYARGIDCDNPRGAVITGNKFINAITKGATALRVGTDNNYYAYQVNKQVIVADNLFINYAGGVAANQGEDLHIHGNVFLDVTDPVYLYDMERVEVTGNQAAVANGGNFIDVRTCTDVLVSGNMARGASGGVYTSFLGYSNNTGFDVTGNVFTDLDPSKFYNYNVASGLPVHLSDNIGLTDTFNPADFPSWQYGEDWEFRTAEGVRILISGNANTLTAKAASGSAAAELPSSRRCANSGAFPRLADTIAIMANCQFNSDDMAWPMFALKWTVVNIDTVSHTYSFTDAVNNAGLTAPQTSYTIAAGGSQTFVLYNNAVTAL